jgi:hypothetical protein
MVPVRPNRISKLLMQKKMNYAWYQKEVNLLERRMVGPFNFASITHRQQETYKIPKVKWQQLREWHEEVDVTDLDQVIPLK